MPASKVTTHRRVTTATRKTDEIPAFRPAVIGNFGTGRWTPRYRPMRGLR